MNFNICKLKYKIDQDVEVSQDRIQTVTNKSISITNIQYDDTEGGGENDLT